MDVYGSEASTLFHEHDKDATNKDKGRKFSQELGKQLFLAIILQSLKTPLVYRNFNTKHDIESFFAGTEVHMNMNHQNTHHYWISKDVL